MSWTYKYLNDLPKIPRELFNYVQLHNVRNSITDRKDMLGYWDGKWELTADYKRDAVNKELQDWVDTNVIKDGYGVLDVGISYMNYNNYQNVKLHPHIDRVRHYTLMYMYDLGGENVITNFWHESGQPLLRADCVFTPTDFANMNPNLELVDSFQAEAEHWILINAKVIHSIENLTRCRYGVQVSLDRHNFITDNF